MELHGTMGGDGVNHLAPALYALAPDMFRDGDIGGGRRKRSRENDNRSANSLKRTPSPPPSYTTGVGPSSEHYVQEINRLRAIIQQLWNSLLAAQSMLKAVKENSQEIDTTQIDPGDRILGADPNRWDPTPPVLQPVPKIKIETKEPLTHSSTTLKGPKEYEEKLSQSRISHTASSPIRFSYASKGARFTTTPAETSALLWPSMHAFSSAMFNRK